MGRPKRAAAGGWIYHVLNRANARTPIFSSPNDLVVRAEEWRWSSLYRWYWVAPEQTSLHATSPFRRSAGWVEHVNSPQTDEGQPGDTHFQQDSDLRFTVPINTICFLLFLAAPDRRGPWPGLPEWKCLLRMKLRLSMS